MQNLFRQKPIDQHDVYDGYDVSCERVFIVTVDLGMKNLHIACPLV